MMEEMSCQVSLENCQGFSIPDGGGRWFHQPGTVNENVLESDLHLHLHLVILQTLLSKASYNWGIHKAINLEEANSRACGSSICKHQCLKLDVSCNWEPVQGDKERFDMGPFGFAEDQSCFCTESSVKVWLCMMEVQVEEHCNIPV